MEVLQRTANRGSISTGYDIDNSLKLEPDNSEYLKSNGTHAYTSPTSNQKGTVSFWIKRTEIGNGVSGKQMYIFASANSARYSNLGFDEFDNLTLYSGDSSWNSVSPYTSNKFRDTSAWYHIVLRYDSTDGTASNRLRVYANGTEVSWTVAPNITQNGIMTYGALSGPTWHSWGTIYAYFTPEKFFAGYLAEVHFVDGQSLAPTEFGETDSDSGIWKPKEYDGTYGNAGYYLDFEDSGNLGDDESGNGFDFDENNITSADQATDTPTNNFCTINPLINYYGSVSEGATKWLHTSGGSGWESFVATMGAGTSGKWYAEFKIVTSGSADNFIGICPIDDPDLNRGADHFPYYGSDTSLDESVGYYAANGQRYIGGGGSAYGNTWASTNIMSIAVDMDNGKVYFAKDGVWQNSGDPTSGSTGTGALDVRGATKPQSLGAGNYTSGENILANYGGYTTISISSPQSDANGYGTFEYAPPSGYYALCTKNLAEYG
tara:strand:+ start:236 stop:1705 length:1470 start_codon:yes stop_codon:yes gene_type:complete